MTFIIKNKIRKTLILFLFALPNFVSAQENDVDFLIKQVRNNYPGYKAKTGGKNFQKWAYNIASENRADTFKALSIILNFFHDRHLQIYDLDPRQAQDSMQCAANLFSIKSYLNQSKKKYRYEGYWLDDHNDCIIALRLVNHHPLAYKAYVIESRDDILKPGQVMASITLDASGKFFTDYYSSLSGGRLFLYTYFRNDSVFTTAPEEKWKKISYRQDSLLSHLPPWSFRPSGHLIDANTYLLSIPSSSAKNVVRIDSIIRADSIILSRTKTLIVDIRGNNGGRSAAFEPLLPIIYTNPIIRASAATYATEEGINQYLEEIEVYKKTNTLSTSEQMEVDKWVKTLRENIGHFVPGDTDTFKSSAIRPFPQNVALIMNYSCQSAAELLVLAFMQSKKVTTFGEHTMGAVDYLDFYPSQTPSKKYTLYMATSKRQFMKGKELDGKGIYPRVPIRDSEPDWIKFVNRYYEKL